MVPTAIAISPEALEVECCQRRVEELTEVITSHSLRFRRIALNQLRNTADAEDAVQDAFVGIDIYGPVQRASEDVNVVDHDRH